MINATEKVKWMQWTEDAGKVIADLSWVMQWIENTGMVIADLSWVMQWTENAGMVIADLSWVTKKSIAEEVRLG